MSNCRYRMPWLCSEYLLERLRLRRAACCLRERPHDAAMRQTDLEGIMPVALGAAQQHVRSAGEGGGRGGLAAKRALGLRVAPRLVRNAAERKSPFPYGVAVEFQPDRDGDESEGI